jgi:hypothetical protein
MPLAWQTLRGSELSELVGNSVDYAPALVTAPRQSMPATP